jgi:hypothetical protein
LAHEKFKGLKKIKNRRTSSSGKKVLEGFRMEVIIPPNNFPPFNFTHPSLLHKIKCRCLRSREKIE